MYRSLSYYFKFLNLKSINYKKTLLFLFKLNFNILTNSLLIFSENISLLSSRMSTFLKLRNILVKIQHNAITNKNLVIIEGRDISTVVFPSSRYKFYFDTNTIIRAIRRYFQFYRYFNTKLYNIISFIHFRDICDITRTISPLLIHDEALLINTNKNSFINTLNYFFDLIYNN